MMADTETDAPKLNFPKENPRNKPKVCIRKIAVYFLMYASFLNPVTPQK